MLFLDNDQSAESVSKPRLPGECNWFAWTFAPWDLGVDNEGYLVAIPGIIEGKPGVNGVGEDKHTGQLQIGAAVLRHREAGRSRIADDTEVETKWGKLPYRVEYRPSPIHGRPQYNKPQYHDAFIKWDLEAGEWVKDVDREGYTAFLRKVAAEMKPSDAQIARAVRKARTEGRECPDKPMILGQEPKPTKNARKPKEG